MADAEEPDEVIATQADKAVERAVEDILEAGAGRADKAIDLVETVLEAGAGRADKAIELIEAILVVDAKELNAEELDEDILEACADQAEEAEGPRFESKLHLWPTPRNLTPKNSTRLDLKPENFRIKAAAKHSIVFRPRELFELRPQQNTRGCLGPEISNQGRSKTLDGV